MEIRYKTIEHERTEDAPFIGALISAIGCKMKCKGCFHKDLKKAPTLKATEQEIIVSVLSNPINEGIILAGLEWSEQPLELLALVGEAAKNNLKIMIYTGLDLFNFQATIGKACAKRVGYDMAYAKEMLGDGENQLYATMGAAMLDYNIFSNYYLKCGMYDKNCLVDNNVQFGVKLASANQKIYKITDQNSQSDEGFELELLAE